MVTCFLRSGLYRKGLGRLGDGRRGQKENEIDVGKIIQCLAVGGEFQLAPGQPRFLQFLQMQMNQRPADADFPRQLADIGPPIACQDGYDPQPMGVGERRQAGKERVSVRSTTRRSIRLRFYA